MSELKASDYIAAMDWNSPLLLLLVELTNTEQTPNRCLTEPALAVIQSAVTANDDRKNEGIFQVLMYAMFVEDASPSMALQLRRLCAQIVPALASMMAVPDFSQPESLQKAAAALGLASAPVVQPRVPVPQRTQPWMSRMPDKK